ncbi:glycerol-3-phosphate responsive antiterminator [Mesobacillus selenatarsenatis]|uniref:Glycerol uptake operon antiterminator regulatory protein n=1 Tax=Mesobacillus selenatarsenatis (strain DSM 18680 / JCM 14380 / FERM P-15431 / SF-1) TaxID=1321606 RepID=A0A0A8X4B3_MESS1|nr:glycerol-3-phosphate responsive antiterminator [Mesobacillus selenatarsenatis]GAM12946.1 glycerol uptake operon antiterminator regulatory protein [Mesobacillus selenatarsenatis SF-1]
MDQKILPASSNMKEFEQFLESPFEIGVMLEVHIAQLKNINAMAKQYGKKMIFHVDMIQGLKSDDYSTEYLCQEYKPYGLISTKSSVILKAKQKGVLAVQRVFLIDSHALEKSYKLIQKTRPDYIEVLPGAMPWMIKEVKERVNIPIFAGGLIRTPEEVKNALDAGADAITTSKRDLWEINQFSNPTHENSRCL